MIAPHMNFRLFRPVSAMILWAGMMLSGCSRVPHIPSIERVPDDAVVVKALDLGRLFKEAGAPLPSSPDSLSPVQSSVVDLVVEPGVRDALVAVISTGEVDLSDVVCFTTERGDDVVALPVVDSVRLLVGIRPFAGQEDFYDDGGFEYGSLCGSVFALKDGHCFIAHDFGVIRETFEKAGHRHFGTLTGVRNFLSDSPVMRLAVNCGRSSLSFLGDCGKWLCVGFNVSAASVSANAVVFSANREISDGYNNSFTEYFQGKRAAIVIGIPPGSVLADAWGIPFGVDFNVSVEAMRVKARIAFPGSPDNALESLLGLPQLPDFKARFHAATGR